MTSDPLVLLLRGFTILAFATPLGLCWRLHHLLAKESQKVRAFYIVASAICLGPALVLLQLPFVDADLAGTAMQPVFYVDLIAASAWVMIAGPIWIFGGVMTIVLHRLAPKSW
jgi:hypothetical protein